MAQGQVGLRFNIDTSQAKTQVSDLSRTIADLNEKIREATEAGDWKSVAQLTQALGDTASARGQIMQQAKQVNPQAQETMKNGGIFGGQYSWLMQNAVNQVVSGFIRILESAHTAAKQRASGDYGGAAVGEQKAEGETWGRAAGTAAGLALNALDLAAPGLGKTLSTILTPIFANIGEYIGGGKSRETELDLTYSAQYEKIFSQLDSLNQLYGGDINKKTFEDNNQHGLEMYSRAAVATEGTGLTTQALIEAMKQIGSYGVRSETQALNMAQNQAVWSRFTGADLSTIQKFAGQSYRYGGETGAVSTAYGGLMAQNMGKGQFTEFLNSMERILEEGIAKGFVRSSEEIAGNMAMLYKLSSGSSLWQGEQGAQRLSQMNMAISNATNLQSVEDVISYGVIARELLGEDESAREANFISHGGQKKNYTGTYVDTMQILERGLSPELLKGQFEAVKRLEGGENRAGIIERFKTMFGLNYTGATDVWAMMNNAETDKDGNLTFDGKDIVGIIEKMKIDPRYQSDSEKWQTAMNKYTDALVNVGKFKFDDTQWSTLQEQAAHVAAIWAELKGTTMPERAILASKENERAW
jgi:hypothetical protein